MPCRKTTQRIKLLPGSFSLSDWCHSAGERCKMPFNFVNQKDSLDSRSSYYTIGSPLRFLGAIFQDIILIKVHNRIIKTTRLEKHKMWSKKRFYFSIQWNWNPFFEMCVRFWCEMHFSLCVLCSNYTFTWISHKASAKSDRKTNARKYILLHAI